MAFQCTLQRKVGQPAPGEWFAAVVCNGAPGFAKGLDPSPSRYAWDGRQAAHRVVFAKSMGRLVACLRDEPRPTPPYAR